MDITITGRNLGLTDRFKEYATEKAEKVGRLAERAIAFEVKVSRQNDSKGAAGGDRVELMLIGPGPLIRAESSASDKYAAFDLAIAKLLERLRQYKDRRKVHRGNHRPVSLAEASASGFGGVGVTPVSPEVLDQVRTGSIPLPSAEEPGEEYSPVVIRRKVFPAETMTVEEAVDRMELVGHDFFLFIDAATDRASVVYRRKGWDYGVISLEEEPASTAVSGGRGKRAMAR